MRKKREKKRNIQSSYPAASPSGKKDPYFPFSGLPRPIFRDMRLFPKFFRIKKKKSWLERKQHRY